jgi:diguanylate cyclase (GGDEF)-like protein
MASGRDLLAGTETVKQAIAALDGLIALAFTCPVTGLHNRRALDEITNLSAAFEGNTHGALMIDLTAFKRINDEAGHAAGDAALGRVGETLRGMCNPSGPFAGALPFRYGGDEFCILVPALIFDDFVHPSNLAKLAWKDFTLHPQVQEPTPRTKGQSLGFGAAIGIARPDAEIELRELIARADVAGKVSKDNGDEPAFWSAAIEHGAMHISRKRCGSCSAAITLHVAKAKVVPDGFNTCPNCGGALR